MARRCTICVHPEKEAIDAALVSGTPIRDIAGQRGLSRAAVSRHKSDHLPAVLTQAKAAATQAHADDLLEKLDDLEQTAREITDEARRAGDHRTELRGVGERRRLLELRAKLRGELNEGAMVNVLVAEQWTGLRAVILVALEPFPEARAAVVRALAPGAGSV